MSSGEGRVTFGDEVEGDRGRRNNESDMYGESYSLTAWQAACGLDLAYCSVPGDFGNKSSKVSKYRSRGTQYATLLYSFKRIKGGHYSFKKIL